MNGTRQKIQYSLALEPVDQGETPVSGYQGTAPFMAKPISESPAVTEQLVEEMCDRENLGRAWKRVRRNKGSPGVDGMTIDDARDYLREHWPSIRSQLLEGTYQPQPVKRVEIPKPDGGVRKLGVPCVVDRLIQQALLQVLQEQWDPTFSGIATASDRDAPLIRRWPKRNDTLPRATASWLTLISKNFSTGSIMTA
jgi:RNA-directed DNA polymerase